MLLTFLNQRLIYDFGVEVLKFIGHSYNKKTRVFGKKEIKRAFVIKGSTIQFLHRQAREGILIHDNFHVMKKLKMNDTNKKQKL